MCFIGIARDISTEIKRNSILSHCNDQCHLEKFDETCFLNPAFEQFYANPSFRNPILAHVGQNALLIQSSLCSSTGASLMDKTSPRRP
jgi:hypothetical protein